MTKQKNLEARIAILMKDGSARKIPRNQSEELLRTGEARRYISKTAYRALQLGLTIKNFDSHDESLRLREAMRKLKEKTAKQKKPAVTATTKVGSDQV